MVENIVSAIKDGFCYGIIHGSFCAFSCGPLFSLFYGKSNMEGYFSSFFLFLLGRFFGYVGTGLVVGLIGDYYENYLPGESLQRISYLLLGLYLIYCVNIKKAECTNKSKRLYFKYFVNSFFVLGFLSAFRICFPVVALVVRCISYGNILMSVLAFFSFFITISFFFIPYLLIGKILSKRVFERGVRVMLLFFGVYFVLKAFGLV